jgi:D-tyrosyl-tRNA(Tyr) deacylase
MRALLQRVSRAEVRVEGHVVGATGPGLLVLLGIGPGDGPAQVAWMADRIEGLRVFADADGRMNRSVRDVGGGILVVSQFTLYGDARSGRRPSFTGAAPPDVARPLVAALVERLAAQTGVFGADMQVELVNDGPVTLLLESP